MSTELKVTKLIFTLLVCFIQLNRVSGFGLSTKFMKCSNLIRNKCSSLSTLSMAEAESPKVNVEPLSAIKVKLTADMKEAMKSKEKERLAGIRAIQAAIKQKEVDERIVVTDEMAVLIMAKLVKQRKESIKSYSDSGRQDLVDAEQKELEVISSYMPQQLSEVNILVSNICL